MVLGSYSDTFLAKHPPELDIYAEKKDGKGGHNGGGTQAFLGWIADSLKIHVVSEVSDNSVHFDWQSYDDMGEGFCGGSAGTNYYPRSWQISRSQTGLSFSQENRPVQVWFIFRVFT